MNNPHVGYCNTSSVVRKIFSEETINFISNSVTESLRDIYNPGIVVNSDIILNILNALYEVNTKPYEDLIKETIELIVETARSELGIERNNFKLSIWNTVFDSKCLKSYPELKLRKTRKLTFNMPLA